MLTGKQKAALLLSLLEDKGKLVLEKLSKDEVSELTAALDDVPENDPEIIESLLRELQVNLSRLRVKRPASAAKSSAPSVESSSLSLGNSSLSSGSLFGGKSSGNDEEENTILSGLRPVEEIADILSKQKPQVIAFVLSKVEPELKQIVLEAMDTSLSQQISAINIKNMPLPDSVFQRIYQTVFVMPPKSEEEDESSNSSGALFG